MPVVNIRSGARYDVYVGRPGKGQPGPWGNPFRPGPGESPGDTLPRYRRWLWAEVRASRIALADLAALDGLTLGCFCKPAPCHGDVLEAAARWAAERVG